jgi:uncharacterized delta-60 repeat protein
LIPFRIVLAQPGILDYSFGVSGISKGPYTTQYSYAYGIAQQADGKILVTGYLEDVTLSTFVTRFDTNGVVDTTFSNPILTIGQLGDYGRAITVQPDGKILVTGFADNSTSDIYVVRLLPSGDYDTTFGSGGIAMTDFGNNTLDQAHDIMLQPDGKILVAGWSLNNDIDIALLRYNTDGSPDSSFGMNGKVSTDINNETQEGHGITLQSDGKILVAGLAFNAVSGNDLAVFRYLADGTIDSSFGVNGISIPPVNQDDDAANDIALQPDGKIVLAGYTYSVISFADKLVVRLDTSGNPDPTFGVSGIVTSNPVNNDCFSTGVLIQPDGKIITTGRAYSATSNFLVSRFNTDGQIDSTFGTNGFTFTSVANGEDFIYGSLLQPDGKVVVAGYYSDNLTENFAVARYNSDSSFNTSIAGYDKNDFIIYPQPAGDKLFIRYDKPLVSAPEHEVCIYNLLGEKLTSSITVENQVITVSCKSLLPGVYVVEINCGEIKSWVKFVKE